MKSRRTSNQHHQTQPTPSVVHATETAAPNNPTAPTTANPHEQNAETDPRERRNQPMKTLTAITITLATLAFTGTVNADVPLPEPDLTYYGSITVDGTLLTVPDPGGIQYRVRATLNGATLDTYRMFSNADAEIATVPQYLLHVPMEFATASSTPTGEAVVLGDTVEFHIESCAFDCDSGGAEWASHSITLHTAAERGTFTQLDLGGVLPCPADTDGSGSVDFQDLVALLAAWGPCGGCPEDIDMDGLVGFQDLLVVLAEWGPCS